MFPYSMSSHFLSPVHTAFRRRPVIVNDHGDGAMAAGAQQFCLKWNNYHVNIASSFDALRVDEDFVDVTLACSGCQLKAHRMVLSACSPFFRQLLKVGEREGELDGGNRGSCCGRKVDGKGVVISW